MIWLNYDVEGKFVDVTSFISIVERLESIHNRSPIFLGFQYNKLFKQENNNVDLELSFYLLDVKFKL